MLLPPPPPLPLPLPTRAEAAARIASFLRRVRRLRRLRPVNEEDPITLEPVDASTSFSLVGPTGVVTAVDAAR